MSRSIVAHDPYSYKPDAPCPKCGVQVTFKGPPLVACPNAKCGWAVILMPGESAELSFAWAGIDRGLNLAAFLAEIASRCAPVADQPGQVLPGKPKPTTHRARVLPDAAERPLDRLERLADQFEYNGAELRWNPDTGLEASSQERDDAANTPVRWYSIYPFDHLWLCECKAGKQNICAHRAGYWRHLDTTLRDPDSDLTPNRRTTMERIYAQLMRQAGVIAPAVPKPARSDAELAAAATQARADLFGEVA
jgi:hypothetical protein